MRGQPLRQGERFYLKLSTNAYRGIGYWLDIGNNADTGQFVLGQPLNRANKHKAQRLSEQFPELFPEIVSDPALDDDQQPSHMR